MHSLCIKNIRNHLLVPHWMSWVSLWERRATLEATHNTTHDNSVRNSTTEYRSVAMSHCRVLRNFTENTLCHVISVAFCNKHNVFSLSKDREISVVDSTWNQFALKPSKWSHDVSWRNCFRFSVIQNEYYKRNDTSIDSNWFYILSTHGIQRGISLPVNNLSAVKWDQIIAISM